MTNDKTIKDLTEAVGSALSLYPFIAAANGGLETDEEKMQRLEFENKQLHTELITERKLRYDAEQKISQLEEIIAQKDEEIKGMTVKKRKKKEPVLDGDREYNPYKSNGTRKARAAESIRSYDDFKAIQDYFLKKNRIRDWALWTVGVSLGLRISDLLSLKFKNVLDTALCFRDRVVIIEKKTSKANDCLITESVVDALTRYFDSIDWKFDLDDYIFKSAKTGGKMHEECGWRIISTAGKALDLPLVIGSHTMRKSFANIAACVDKSSVDMNSITKVQGLLNHSNQQTTMRYLGTYKRMFDNARIAVSDFVLGKSGVNELVAGTAHTVDDVLAKLDLLETKLTPNEESATTNP